MVYLSMEWRELYNVCFTTKKNVGFLPDIVLNLEKGEKNNEIF